MEALIMAMGSIDQVGGAKYTGQAHKNSALAKKETTHEIKDKVTLGKGDKTHGLTKESWSYTGKIVGGLFGAAIGTVVGVAIGAIGGGVIGAHVGGPIGAAIGGVIGAAGGGFGGFFIGGKLGVNSN